MTSIDVEAQWEAPISEHEATRYVVTTIEHLTATIAEVWLRPLAAPMTYSPGAYVLLEDLVGHFQPRAYSIANAPREDGLISLLITRVPGGHTSGWVHQRLAAGDEVLVTGPYGTFVADPSSSAPRLHLAAGSGLGPIRALIEAALEGPPRQSLTLIVSARTEAEVMDRERFGRWQDIHPQFHFVRTLTRDIGPDPHGRIPTLLPRLCPDLDGHEVFVAGARGFVRACSWAAQALGASPECIHTESFSFL